MAAIKYLVVHCTAGEFGCARTVREFHMSEPPLGRGWRDIGYQFVILNGRPYSHEVYFPFLDGVIEAGRPLDGDRYLVGVEVGAHAYGINSESIGVTLVGVSKFTDPQMQSLRQLYHWAAQQWGVELHNVLGHAEVQKRFKLVDPAQGLKSCPNMDMAKVRDFLKRTV